jgi:hypothetical protein
MIDHDADGGAGEVVRTDGPLSAAAYAEFAAQGPIPPGTPGWWQVWGAQVRHIRPGDLVISKAGDEVLEASFIQDTYLAKASPLRWGVLVEDRRMTFGALTAIVLLRRDTHNLLAD